MESYLAGNGAVAMEYRGMEYAVVRTIPNGWRWFVRRDRKDRIGISYSREEAIARAKKFIDELVRRRAKTQE
jgi:hypothetical protein